MSRLLTYVLLVTLIGCETKEYKKNQNSNVDVVSDLNQGNSEKVIDKLQAKESLTSRERSYLASALSQKGGVDVYSLYPVLEMQLFRKNALEWSDLAKDKNPYMKFMKNIENVDEKALLKKREARWEKNLKRKGPELIKPSLESFEGTKSVEEYEANDIVYKKKYEEIMQSPLNAKEREAMWDRFIDSILLTRNLPIKEYEHLIYYKNLSENETRKQAYLHPEKKVSDFKSNIGWEILYMNLLWSTYEAISIMKQLPILEANQQDAISASLAEYKKLTHDAEFEKVAVKNIMVLTGVSLLSIYKSSFALDEIKSMQDMLCTFEPNVIIENYQLIRNRVIFLAEVINESSMNKELKEYKGRIDELKAKLPENLTHEEETTHVKKVEDYQEEKCFQG
jgi:hypothetical protein